MHATAIVSIVIALLTAISSILGSLHLHNKVARNKLDDVNQWIDLLKIILQKCDDILTKKQIQDKLQDLNIKRVKLNKAIIKGL